MKIALVRCPGGAVDTPPIGIGYLISSLKTKGHEVLPFDFNIKLYHSSLKQHNLWETYNMFWQRDFDEQKEMFEKNAKKWARKILDTNAPVIGFSVFGANKILSVETARRIKEEEKDKIVIFGGPECNLYTLKQFFSSFRHIDAFVIGEGEVTLLELIKQFEKGMLKPVKGSVVQKNEFLYDGGGREPIENLNSLPFPDFSSLPIKSYTDQKTIHIQMSRGCYQGCVFCMEHVYWKKYRCRKAENVFNEMKLRFENGYRKFRFCDSVLNGNVKELETLCDLIINEGLDSEIFWMGSFRCRQEMTVEIVEKLKKAGCIGAIFGVESGSQKILNLMGKGYKIDIIEQNLKNFHDAGINVHMNLIVGFPGENKKTLKKTLNFVEKNQKHIDKIEINSLIAMPLSRLFENYKSFGITTLNDSIHNDWVSEKNTKDWRKEQVLKVQQFVENLGIEAIVWR